MTPEDVPVDPVVGEIVDLEAIGPFGHAEHCMTRLLVPGIACDCEIGRTLADLYEMVGGDTSPLLDVARRLAWQPGI